MITDQKKIADNIEELKEKNDSLAGEAQALRSGREELEQENNKLRHDHQAWQERVRALLGKMEHVEESCSHWQPMWCQFSENTQALFLITQRGIEVYRLKTSDTRGTTCSYLRTVKQSHVHYFWCHYHHKPVQRQEGKTPSGRSTCFMPPSFDLFIH